MLFWDGNLSRSLPLIMSVEGEGTLEPSRHDKAFHLGGDEWGEWMMNKEDERQSLYAVNGVW